MSQATLPPDPYLNSNLFSGYYLDNRVDDLDAWDCDDEAQEVFDELQALWDAERDLVASYNEDDLLDKWIDEVLGVLGFAVTDRRRTAASHYFSTMLSSTVSPKCRPPSSR